MNSFRDRNGSKCSIPPEPVGSLLRIGNFFFLKQSLFDVCDLVSCLSLILVRGNYKHMFRYLWTVIYIKAKWCIRQLYG